MHGILFWLFLEPQSNQNVTQIRYSFCVYAMGSNIVLRIFVPDLYYILV